MRCDCHVHIVGEADRYPQTPTRTYLASVARLDSLERNGAGHGITRFVLVQISVYGDDNTLLLEGLDRLGDRGRGVVTVDPRTATRETLQDWAARGVAGIRFNLYSSTSIKNVGGRFEDTFDAMAKLARPLGWHVEVIAPIKLLAEHADVLARSDVPIVLDHYGLHGNSAPDSGEGRRLLDLLRRSHVWIKLSGAYRVSEDPLATRPNPDWLAAILSVAGDHCVWGSDWPHTPLHSIEQGPDVEVPYRRLDYEDVVSGFLGALPSRELADRIMIDNPSRLYGFPARPTAAKTTQPSACCSRTIP